MNCTQLTPDPDYEGSMFYSQGNKALKKYTKFIIEPVTIYISPDIKANTEEIDPELINKITIYFKNALVKVIKNRFEIVDKPGHDVARIRCAITGVQLKRKDLKAYNLIPISLIITAAGEATGIRDSLTVLNMEAELLDSITGRRMAAVVQRRSQEVDVKNPEELKGQDVYPLLDFWAEKVEWRLEQIHGY
ncbi:MAG: DUF3313 domain-containing protein [Desulfobacteraceae bacterium]|nr:DUF3313 domain-containing protein [Desulfobacteraceae bacterium]